jgi:hypothetical protein
MINGLLGYTVFWISDAYGTYATTHRSLVIEKLSDKGALSVLKNKRGGCFCT